MKREKFFLILYIALLLIIFILPYFSSKGYSILLHTTSQLGAQNTPYSWVMNMIFVLLGFTCIWKAFTYLKNYPIHRLLLVIFGFSLISTAIFQHAPIDKNLEYDILEDKIHSISASVVGFSFTLFSFSTLFIEKTKKRRIIALLVVFSSTLLSLFMFLLNGFSGIWQRLIFIISFAWIIFFLEEVKMNKQKYFL